MIFAYSDRLEGSVNEKSTVLVLSYVMYNKMI